MKLLLDIGNTACSIGIHDGRELKGKFFIKTDKEEVPEKALCRMLSRWSGKIKQVRLVSVVPKATDKFKALLKRVLPDVPILEAGRDLEIPIINKYARPEEVGWDRLVGAYAAARKYGSPVIVVDFGTAVTFDVVNASTEYEGGLIFPGYSISLGALIEKAALLRDKAPCDQPQAELPVVGRATSESISSGMRHGYAAMCDGVLDNIFSELGCRALVVATGGEIDTVVPFSKNIDTIDITLIFSGLRDLPVRSRT